MAANCTSSIYIRHCSDSETSSLIYITFLVAKTLILLPSSTLVLYLGHQRWRRQRSFATTSHSDVISYHMAALNLIFCFGTILFSSVFISYSPASTVGFYLISTTLPGEVALHVLTCVERYLAVVHPVTYMGLRQSGGVRIRNIGVACAWLLCLGWSFTVEEENDVVLLTFFTLMMASLIAVSFCSFSVLCVLIRPGPGEVAHPRERVDQSKQRAFYTVMAITGMLSLWFAGLLVGLALSMSTLLSYEAGCVMLISTYWLSLPSSFVLPLLFLHRAGKWLCCH